MKLLDLFKKRNDSTQGERIIYRLKQDSPPMEAYRILRTNLEFSGTTKKVQTILLTSATPQEGKTTTSCNLAKTFAYAGTKTLLIDFDLRRPALHHYFNLENKQGCMDHILGKVSLEEAVKPTETENLFLLNAGTLPPDPAEILASPKMESIINQLRENYEVIIIDTPPVAALADASIASRLADAVILVATVKKTRVDDLQTALNNLQTSGANVHGFIMNDVTKQTRGYKHYSYYAKYY